VSASELQHSHVTLSPRYHAPRGNEIKVSIKVSIDEGGTVEFNHFWSEVQSETLKVYQKSEFQILVW
jgi:hypothetical protein